MAFVYILQSKINSRYYIGSTNDIRRRLKEHNQGRSKYTKFSRPFALVFLQEYNTLTEARRVEFRLKKLKNKSIIKQIVEDGYIKLKPQ